MAKKRIASIQIERVDTFRHSRSDVVASFHQSSESLAVVQIFKDSDMIIPYSSSIIPGTIHCVSSSSKGDVIAIAVDDKCGISRSSQIDFEYFNIQGVRSNSSSMNFSPIDVNQLGILHERDIRIYDLASCFSTSAHISKPLAVLSGAAAQASPTSFSYDPNQPDLIVSGWDIPNNQYLRLVDLREGTHKSLRILKTPSIHNISLSRVDNRYLASTSDSSITVFDMRKLCVPKSSSRIEPVYSRSTPTGTKELCWSPTKTSTIAICSESSSLSVWRLDLNRLLPISQDTDTFVWSRYRPDRLITMESSSGKLVPQEVPNFPLPIFNPRDGCLLSFSTTASTSATQLYRSELHESVKVIAEKLGQSPDYSLIDAIEKTDPNIGLCEHLDWAFSDTVNMEVLKTSLVDRIPKLSDKASESSRNRFGLIPLLNYSSSRSFWMECLIPKKYSAPIIELMIGDFEALLRSLIQDKFPNHEFVQSVTLHVIGGDIRSPLVGNKSLPKIFQSTISIVNQLLGAEQNMVELVLKTTLINNVAIVDDDESSENVDVFVSTCFAMMYLEDLTEFFNHISTIKIKSVRGMVITGLNSSMLQLGDMDPLHVALVGLLLTNDSNEQKQLFFKQINFLRNLCNQLGGDCWSLRAIIDTVLVSDPSKVFGSTTMVCYYCSRPLVGDLSLSGGSGVICRCPNRGCHKPLPSCCVCLEPINVAPSPTIFCTTCRHGGHKEHLVDWFETSDECPVAGCNCQCANVDGC